MHSVYIQRCIDLGKKGLGITRPNPMVGCVIIHKNKIIGEGYTSPYGGSHAEVNAINSVEDSTLLKESSLYVTLEPCSHDGKTPPCVDLIIAHKIPNVIIGCIDPNPLVSGKGIEILKQSGCDVTIGVLEKECQEHHKRFLTFQNHNRPYIILKWAQTQDGFIAPISKEVSQPVWITNEISRQLVHKWRSEEQAILVGAKTVIEDNPSLTVRDWAGHHPIRIVVDKNNSLSKDYSIFNTEAHTLVISEDSIDFSKPIANQICNVLYKRSINSVIVEGGTKTLQSFIDNNLWDEARIFVGIHTFENGVKAPQFNASPIQEKHILNDILKIYRND